MVKKKTISDHKSASFDDYEAAFQKLFNTTKADFELMSEENTKPVRFIFHDDIYQVLSYCDLIKKAEEILSLHKLAANIPPDNWLEIAEDVHLLPAFHNSLMTKLKGMEEFIVLDIAMSLSNSVSQDSSVFWNCLFELDNKSTYGKAIVAACETFDFEVMVEEFVDAAIEDPTELIPDLLDSFFESVKLIEEQDGVDEYVLDQVFYVYRIDPALCRIPRSQLIT